MSYQELCNRLLTNLDKHYHQQLADIFADRWCELEGGFLGFIEEYWALSKVIPKHFTVVDLGCYAATQAFYFRKHKKYIGVDSSQVHRINPTNSEHYTMSIQNFLNSSICKGLKLDTTFAICNYVPTDSLDIRKLFKNLFVFYPAGTEIRALNHASRRVRHDPR